MQLFPNKALVVTTMHTIRKTRIFVYIEVPMLYRMKFIRSPEAIASNSSNDTSCRYSFTSYMSHEYFLLDGNI